MDERREANRRECEGLGLARAKARLIEITDIPTHINFSEWIAEEEQKANAAREEQQRLWNEQALAAAQLSANTSREAALASQRSAKWTMWAAIATAAGAVATAASLVAPLLQAVSCAPKP